MTARSTRNLLRQSIMIWIVREESPAIDERLNGLVKQSRLSSMWVFDISLLAAGVPFLAGVAGGYLRPLRPELDCEERVSTVVAASLWLQTSLLRRDAEFLDQRAHGRDFLAEKDSGAGRRGEGADIDVEAEMLARGSACGARQAEA